MNELKAIESATAVIENVYLVYRKTEVDKVIAEKDAEIAKLKDKIQQKDFFWEGCGFSKMGFKNTIAVANYVEDLKARVDSLQRENRILKQYKLAAHSSYGIGGDK